MKTSNDKPSDEELLCLALGYERLTIDRLYGEVVTYHANGQELIAFARAVLDSYGHQPASPAEGEVRELMTLLRAEASDDEIEDHLLWMTSTNARRAAELLEQHHPAPVPVSERLPGPEDCDAEHYCWRWNTIGRLWAKQPMARRWYDFESHWLPAYALPLPAGPVA